MIHKIWLVLSRKIKSSEQRWSESLREYFELNINMYCQKRLKEQYSHPVSQNQQKFTNPQKQSA